MCMYACIIQIRGKFKSITPKKYVRVLRWSKLSHPIL